MTTGSILITDCFNASCQVITINTTVNNWIEILNDSGALTAFNNYMMIVSQT